MKVLLVSRPHLAIGGGGDKVVIIKTQEYLNNLGISAQVTYEINPDYHGFDIAHLFTLSTWHAAKRAKEFGIPFVVSTIYWDSSESEKWILNQKPLPIRLVRQWLANHRRTWNLISLIRNTARLANGSLGKLKPAISVSLSAHKILSDEIKYRGQILEWAHCLMPSSETEMRHIEQKFGRKYPYVMVPHGVEPLFFAGRAEEFISQHSIGDFVLCVAAGANYRKNQLSLIRAMKGTDIPLVIVCGIRSKAERKYFDKCRKEGDLNVHFFPLMPREKLASAYKAAKVFALPSLFDHPGLVYLEAGAAGCNVVATEIGSARDYLSDFAWYCNPFDIYSIREAVLKAYRSPKNNSLQQHLMNNFTWERATEITLSVYHKVLGGDF